MSEPRKKSWVFLSYGGLQLLVLVMIDQKDNPNPSVSTEHLFIRL